MIKFKIDTDNLKKLNSLGNQVKDLISTTKPIIFVEGNKLVVRHFSLKNCMEYEVDITESGVDEDCNYFTMPITDFITTIDKVSLNCSNDLYISVVPKANSITFRNAVNNTEITITVFNEKISDEEVDTAKNMISTYLENYFTDAHDVKITPEVISFIDTCQKFMNITARSNSVAVNGNTAKYYDYSSLMKLDLSEEVAEHEDIYIRKPLTDFVKPFVKSAGSMNVKLDNSFTHAYIDAASFGLTAIISIDAPSFEWQNEDVLAPYIPTESEPVAKIRISKDDLNEAIGMFNGTFQTNVWGDWKPITIKFTKEGFEKGVAHLSHNDDFAICDTDLKFETVFNNEPSEEITFNFCSWGLAEAASLSNDRTFTVLISSDPNKHLWVETGALHNLSVKVGNSRS